MLRTRTATSARPLSQSTILALALVAPQDADHCHVGHCPVPSDTKTPLRGGLPVVTLPICTIMVRSGKML